MRNPIHCLLGRILLVMVMIIPSGKAYADWYYHWRCNGDSQCLALNPTGQPSGTINEGPVYSMCSQLLEFASRFWGSAAYNTCDNSPVIQPPPSTVPVIFSINRTEGMASAYGTEHGPVASSPTTFIIDGSLLENARVLFDGVGASVLSSLNNVIRFRAPFMADYVGPITLTSAGGTTTSSFSISIRNDLYAVVWAGTQFVAVGGNGTILTSNDSIQWTKRGPKVGNTLYAIAWSGNQFVAVGIDGGVTSSPDGVTWTNRTTRWAGHLFAVTWSGTKFVAVGGSGGFYSLDGIQWSKASMCTGAPMLGITWSRQRFVAAGDNNYICTSPDKIQWTLSYPNFGGQIYFRDVAASPSQFVVIGSSSTVATSPDGTDWTRQSTPGVTPDLTRVTWSGTQFVGTSAGRVYTSPDGSAWSLIYDNDSNTFYGIAASPTQWVAVGRGGVIRTGSLTNNGPIAISLQSGWNLVGNSSNAPLSVATTFGDANKVNSVWKWIQPTGKWAFYSPKYADGGAAFATSRKYDTFTTVNSGEGFWVNAKAAFSFQLPSRNAVTSSSFAGMASGWNLIATGDNVTPSQFNTAQSASVRTIWTWDATKSKWFFYAPSLNNSDLETYISSKDFLDFTANSKTLGEGVGFWVDK